MHPDPELSRLSAEQWTLAAIVEVDRADRIQCQCNGCGQTVFKRVHIIQFKRGGIECWGSSCYAREIGANSGRVEPRFSSHTGRKLTPEEREWLRSNRDRLIKEFQAERERERLEAEARAAHAKAEAARAAAESAARAQEFARELRAWKLPRRGTGPAVRNTPPAVRFPAEPLDDPLYREVRDRRAAMFREQGIDIERPGQRIMFLQNVRADYDRERGKR